MIATAMSGKPAMANGARILVTLTLLFSLLGLRAEALEEEAHHGKEQNHGGRG